MMRFFTKEANKVLLPKVRQICHAARISRETPAEITMGGDDIYEITSDSPLSIGKQFEINQLSNTLSKLNISFVRFSYAESKDKCQQFPALLIEENQLLKLKKISR